MEEIIHHEISTTLIEKDAELQRLRDQLQSTKDQVRTLQQEILASKLKDNFLILRDEDYFDTTCQQLCGHVQQWVLCFSKFSDKTPCHLTSEITDEKVVDHFKNAILDGSDVDIYLSDRVKRRDVFMSITMTMIWEYIFTRYLFGMDREQRQKLKSLEKTLSEVGPASAISLWRATTLTLLSRRPAFANQRSQDTEAVLHEIYHTLSVFLPPPAQDELKLMNGLRNVLRSAVDLAIEMRTQKDEYIMMDILQPEYDTRGEFVRKVRFNAETMNERGGKDGAGDSVFSNEELQDKGCVVQMVLFPLVLKRVTRDGNGGSPGISQGAVEEVVVCPAQVLVAKPPRDKRVVRVLSGDVGAEIGRGSELGGLGAGRRSGLSVVLEGEGSDVAMI